MGAAWSGSASGASRPAAKDELEALRAAARAEGGEFRYRASRTPLSPQEIERRARDGSPFVVRFRMPEGTIRFARVSGKANWEGPR